MAGGLNHEGVSPPLQPDHCARMAWPTRTIQFTKLKGNMKLTTFFSDHRRELLEKELIGQTHSQALNLIAEELATICQKGVYRDALTPSEAKLGFAMLSQIRSAFLATVALQPDAQSTAEGGGAVIPPGTQIPRADAFSLDLGHLTTVAGTVVGAILGGRIGAVLGGVGGLLVGKVVQAVSASKTVAEVAPKLSPAVDARVTHQAAQLLLAYLEQAFREVDNVMESARMKPIQKPAEDDSYLDFFQELLGAFTIDDNSQFLRVMRNKKEQVATLLLRTGIEPVFYEEALDEARSKDLFDFETSRSAQTATARTMLPALDRDGTVIRKGRVLRPQRN
jgi:hypothetical protein